LGFTATRDEANPSMGLIPVKPTPKACGPPRALNNIKSIKNLSCYLVGTCQVSYEK
jgi:hypothetical protein